MKLFCSSEVPGLVLAAFIVDRVGRKVSMVIMFTLGFIFLLPLVVQQNGVLTTALLFGARMFVSATFEVACVYAPEVSLWPASLCKHAYLFNLKSLCPLECSAKHSKKHTSKSNLLSGRSYS